jgi:hypothetical protein
MKKPPAPAPQYSHAVPVQRDLTKTDGFDDDIPF